MADYLVKGETLVALADTVRSKTGSAEPVIFPEGVAAAIGNSPEADLAVTLWAERVKADNLSYMLYRCRSLTTLPTFDASSATTMSHMCHGCVNLEEVPHLDTSNVTDIGYAFMECEKLRIVPPLNTSKAATVSYMFNSCIVLKTVPLLDFSAVKNMSGVFNSCLELKVIPALDIRNLASCAGPFNNCRAVTEMWVRNIKCDLQVGSGTSWGHLLTVDSLTHLIYECRDTGSNKTLTIGSANMEKLANTYVKTIDITDEMRAEDDLIDEKLPFVVCDSTDEGAMLITSYVRLKNWTLA